MSDTPINILLLEDSSLDAELMGEHLRRASIAYTFERVWTEADFTAALAGRSYGLILADYTLPSFDGLSALKIARERSPKTPFIIASATLSEESAIEAMREGASDFVVKERLNRLPNAVRRALAESAERAGRERAERRLEEINARLEAIVAERTRERDLVWRASQDLFVICGFDGLCQSVNPAWTEALGYERDELVGSRLDALVHPDDVVSTRAEFERVVGGASIRDFDIRVRTSDGGYRWYSWTCIPAEAEAFYAAGRDITVRKELEEQLRQSQKMEAIGQLTGGVAHDFNNLLTVIIGNLEMLERRESRALSERGRAAIANAMEGAQRAARLTSSLLAFSRRQPLEPKVIDANGLIEGMTELLRRSLGERVELETSLDEALWQTRADANQLEAAILNLAVNARDAMSEGGRLTIETAKVVLDGEYSRDNPEASPGDYVGIYVSDTGHGMDTETASRAFDPFFTTKDIGQGTGLGLSQVYGFVKQSGGHIKIYSEAGRGTTIKVYLPATEAAADKAANEARDLAVPTGTETILVVEDEEGVRDHSVSILAELGYKVLQASDGPQALGILADNPGIDLLLTDLGLPKGMDGEKLAALARQRSPRIKVLFASGYARSVVTGDGPLPPGTELITKPFTFSALAQRVRRLLDQGAGRAKTERPRIGRILVVEDEPLIRMNAVDMLEVAGFLVEEAGTAAEAIEKAKRMDGQLLAAMVDVGLPDRSGDELATDLRTSHPDLPILVASGHSEAGLRRQFGAESGIAFVAKPYQSEDILRSLAALGVRGEPHEQSD